MLPRLGDACNGKEDIAKGAIDLSKRNKMATCEHPDKLFLQLFEVSIVSASEPRRLHSGHEETSSVPAASDVLWGSDRVLCLSYT